LIDVEYLQNGNYSSAENLEKWFKNFLRLFLIFYKKMTPGFVYRGAGLSDCQKEKSW